VIATQLLEDIALILQAFESMFGGFRERAQATYDMLKASDTAFLVVAAPEPDALREASYFVRRLQEEAMPLGGLVLNRVPHVPPGGRAINGERSLAGSEILAEEDPANLTAALLLVHADLVTEATHARHLSTRFRAANPEVPVAEVPALAEDVHDLDGLRTIGSAMARDLT
jgi:anion-transporting  ArsA/GET3 family ATPase